ncbi:MAG: hypothetical protein PHI18_03635 [bacterium]|nr:hypothetical protein [bacterium]
MNRSRCGDERVHAWSVLLAWVVLALIALALGCRSKDNPAGPDDPPTGSWRLWLDAPPSMFRNEPGGHVENDTITLRLLNPLGQVPAGVRIISQCDVSRDSVTLNTWTYSDTVAFPWGCNPPLIYWGGGGAEGHEVVRSWAVTIAQNDTDTLASASVSVKVFDPIVLAP